MKQRTALLIDVCLIALLAGFLCFYNLGSNSFGAGDQTTHSKVVQEMVQEGNWWAPTRYGVPYYNKPPFKLWLSALGVLALGESNFSYRFVDALAGTVTVIAVFLFAHALFCSRLGAYAAAVGLCGTVQFLFGHGARVATQDSMLLLLTTGATILGWLLLREFERTDGGRSARREAALSVGGGILVGLAVLTKSIAGLMPLVVLAVFALLSGRAFSWRRREWRCCGAAILTGVVVPALYFVPRLTVAEGMGSLMWHHEIVRRALRGYHNLGNDWFYLKAIFEDNYTLPPLVLVLSLLFVLCFVRDARLFFSLCWAAVPVAVYSLARSKIEWYINPALPALSLLVGAFVSWLVTLTVPLLETPPRKGRIETLGAVCATVLLCYTVYALGANLVENARQVLEQTTRRVPDLLVEHALAKRGRRPAEPIVLLFKQADLSSPERFYWDMLGLEKIDSLAELGDRIAGGADYILLTREMFPSVVKQYPARAYALLEPWHKRRDPIYLLSYEQDPLPRALTPTVQTLRFAGPALHFVWGWSKDGNFGPREIRPARGEKAAVLIDGDAARRSLGTEAILRAAALIQKEEGGLEVAVSLNDQAVVRLFFEEGGFVERVFDIPGPLWMSGENLLTFRFQRTDGAEIAPLRPIMLFEELRLVLRQ